MNAEYAPIGDGGQLNYLHVMAPAEYSQALEPGLGSFPATQLHTRKSLVGLESIFS